MRQHFNEALEELKQEVVRMSTIVEESIQDAIKAFVGKDSEAAKRIIKHDTVINEMQIDIEDRCTMLIAREQPVASDLRGIIAVIKMSSNLERIGDHAVHLAKTTLRLKGTGYFDQVILIISRMAEIGLSMIREAMSAFVEKDVEKAVKTAELDQQIDELHKELFTNLIEYLRKNPEHIWEGTDLLFINRFMERFGDHVTNMCEWIIFSTTGKHQELN